MLGAHLHAVARFLAEHVGAYQLPESVLGGKARCTREILGILFRQLVDAWLFVAIVLDVLRTLGVHDVVRLRAAGVPHRAHVEPTSLVAALLDMMHRTRGETGDRLVCRLLGRGRPTEDH